MSTDYSWHAIAVGNRLLGLYNIVFLKAPPTWRIIIMPTSSDVFRHREKMASSGYATAKLCIL
jgi:hypothetical protein